MKKLLLSIALYLLCFASYCQTGSKPADFNFGFEKVTPGMELPDNWFRWGDENYNLIIDSTIKRSGKYALRIEPQIAVTEDNFGCCAYQIPAGYKGRKIELQAYLKMENAEAPVGLLLRIDGEAGGLEFDNMVKRNIRGTSDWTKYSVILPYPKEAQNIYIGFLLSGTGKLWADDFRVLIDGKELEKAKKIQPEATIIDTDTEFSKSSGIVIDSLEVEKIEDLVVLGKVWGFLKYYHPAVMAGKYNWDNELFRIMPDIIACKNAKDRNEILSSWIGKLGDFNPGKEKTPDASEIKLRPDLEWLNDQVVLGENLVKLLNRVKNADREDESFYIAMAPNVGNPQFQHERAYSEIIHPDAGYTLLALYRYWNMIQYFYPNRHLMDEDWSKMLKEFVPIFVNARDDAAFQLAVLALIAKVQDTHANIWGYHEELEKFNGLNYAPYEIIFVENKAVVKDYFELTNGTDDTSLQRGDILIKINGRDVEDIVKEKLPYTPASNYPTQLRDLAGTLLRTNDSSLNIVYERDGVTQSASIQCLLPSQLDMYSKYRRTDTCFKYLEPGIVYIYPGTIKSEYLPNVMHDFLKAKGIIIDLRCYPSDFIVFDLTKYLVPKSTAFVKFSEGSTETPGLFTLTENLMVGKRNPDYYKGKVVILVNEETQSQAEYTAMALRVAPRAIVIGSTTAGADGNVSSIQLPGGINTWISGIGIYYPDGTETQRVGIVPDVEVKPTINGLKEGKDEVLQRAIEIIKEK